LAEALLRKKRILAIVDGISEMSNIDEKQFVPELGGKLSRLVVYTSRKPIQIPESTIIYPMGLRIDFLDMLLDNFTNSYAEAYKFGEQREILRARVKLMLAELSGNDPSKPVALSLLKEIVRQASQLIDEQKPLSEFLPKSVGELYDSYTADLFRNIKNGEELIDQLREASLISVGLGRLLDSTFSSDHPIEIKPTWIPKSNYTKFISSEKIDIFLSSGAMNSTGDVGVTYIKFKHDPLGEYLAGVKIILMYKQGIISNKQLQFIHNSSNSISFLTLLKSTANRMNVSVPF
jgi:hypothetical protein